MTAVHVVIGAAVLALSLASGILGGLSWLQRRPSEWFWYLLRLTQGAVVAQVLLGMLLIFFGRDYDELHVLYGVLPLAVSLLGEGARAGAAGQEIGETEFESLPPTEQRELALEIFRRETGIMAVSCIVIFFLALRAAGTTSLI